MKNVIKLLALIGALTAATAEAERTVRGGATSQCFRVYVSDTSDAGHGLTGLVYNSASLACTYHRQGDAADTVITLASSTLGTYTSGAFKEVDATAAPGMYEFCPPNTALAAGATEVAFECKGATDMADMVLLVQIDQPTVTSAMDTASIEPQDFAPDGEFQTGSTTTSLILDASETSNSIVQQTICVTSGVAAKECALVTAYDTGTKTATVEPALSNAPGNGDGYSIGNINRGFAGTAGIEGASYASDTPFYVRTAQAVGANTITLDASAPYGNNTLNNNSSIWISSSTNGNGTVQCVKSYNSTSKVATMIGNWPVLPTGTIKYMVLPNASCNPQIYPQGN